MSETTPNAKGPAMRPMSPEQKAALGSLATPGATADQEPTPVPADQIRPEDIGTLSIEYRGGRPVVTVRGGSFVPQSLPVLDEAGTPVAVFSVGPIPQSQTVSRDDFTLVYEPYPAVFDTGYSGAWTLGRTVALADMPDLPEA